MKRLLLSAGIVSCGFCSIGFADDEVSKRFKKFDTNQDNILTEADLQATEARFFDRILRIGDVNNDGKVTLEEFTQLTSKMDPAATRTSESTDSKLRRDAVRPEGEVMEMRKRLFDETFDRFDRDGDGKISRDEAPKGATRIQELFDQLETDSISKEQFRNVMEVVAQEGIRRMSRPTGDGSMGPARDRPSPGVEGEPGNRPRSERPQSPLFRLLDADRNGRLTKEELANAQKVLMQLDRNQDGELDLAEVMGLPDGERPRMNGDAPPGSPGRPSGERGPEAGRSVGDREAMRRSPVEMGQGNELFRRFDADKDGALTKEEVADSWIADRFEMIDANEDGKVTGDEIRRFMSQRRRDSGETPPARKIEASKD